MGSKNNEPSIRFIGFNDNWELRKLGEVCEVKTGYAFSSDNFDDNGEFLVITNGNIQQSSPYVDGTIGNKIDIKDSTILNEYILNKNDILVTMDGTVGRTAKVIEDKQILAQRVGRLVAKLEPEFLYQSLNTGQFFETMTLISTGGTIKHISLGEISGYTIYVPSSEKEQQELGKFFSSLDKLITLHQRKLDNLEILKKTLLDKLFPKNKETKPLYRFNGFLDVWKQRKLGEMGKTFTGLSGKTKDDFGHGDAEFVTYMNIFSNSLANIEKTENVEIDERQNEVEYGDIFFTTSSETSEEVGMSSVWLGNKPNVYLNSFCFGYRPMEKLDSYYMAYMLRSSEVRKKFQFLAQGISRYNISKTKVMELSVFIPKMEEQIAIGQLFNNLDNLITLHRSKCDHLKNMKKYFLNNMFI